MIVSNKDTFLKDTSLFESAMAKLTEHLHTNYYDLYREWHYKDIEPRIFAEELLGEEVQNGEWEVPTDYKIHCFGNTMYMQIDTDRFTNHTRTFFDSHWQPMPFDLCYPKPQILPNKPNNAALLFEIAKALSGAFVVRVDLYDINGRIIVGELTFTHGGGTEKFTPKEWDKTFGDLWGRAQPLS